MNNEPTIGQILTATDELYGARTGVVTSLTPFFVSIQYGRNYGDAYDYRLSDSNLRPATESEIDELRRFVASQESDGSMEMLSAGNHLMRALTEPEYL